MNDAQGSFAARRAAVLDRMRARGGGVMLLPAAREKLRNNDVEFPFRQDSDFYYLTGFDEPEGCAVLVADPEPRFVLFVRPRDRDREIWTGFRAGVEGAIAEYRADQAYPIGEMEARLPEFLNHRGPLWFRIGHDSVWDERIARILASLRTRVRTGVRAPTVMIDSGVVLHEMRLLKAEPELERLRRAVEITAEAHLCAMRAGVVGAREYEVQAETEHLFRRRGGTGPGYGTIVAAGANSCTLHHLAGDALLRDGDVCLVDAAAELELYTADVTRTFPVSGKFTLGQRRLYEVCLDAQLQAIAAVRPGATLDSVHDVAVHRLTEGMIELGLLQGRAEDRIADSSYRKYYMHRTSHWLGMDAHDVGAYYDDEGKPRALVPGMVLTIEPGIYVGADDEQAPSEMRGVGIRIEDDLVVTSEGNEVLTASIPKSVAEVEAACARSRTSATRPCKP